MCSWLGGQVSTPTLLGHRGVSHEEDSGVPADNPSALGSAPESDEAADEEELSDEALALRLQQEELAAQNARFMQMAGIGMGI